MEEWFILHPRAARAVSLALVVIAGVLFVRIVRTDEKIAALITERSKEARAASEALGG